MSLSRCFWDYATRGKNGNTKTVREQKYRKVQIYPRTGWTTLLKVGDAIQNVVLVRCFLGWDCFGVQVIIFQI